MAAEAMKIRRVDQLARAIASDPTLEAEFKSDPKAAAAKLASFPLDNDVWIYRTVVGALSFLAIVAMGGTIALANTEHGIPDALISLGSAAVGALAGLLAPSPRAAS